MYRFMIFLAGVGAIWWGLTMDATTKMMILNNAFWLLVVGVMAIIILYLIASIVKLNRHDVTIYDNRQWNTDNSSHNTTNTAYIGADAASQLGANNSRYLTSGD